MPEFNNDNTIAKKGRNLLESLILLIARLRPIPRGSNLDIFDILSIPPQETKTGTDFQSESQDTS